MLTVERLNQSVEYDQITGVFKRKSASKFHARSNGQPILTADSYGYIVFKIDRKMYKAHRVAWFLVYGVWPDQIDHINGDPADNRISNLRLATTKQNNENRRAGRNNTSGIVGVRQQKYGKWRAYIYHHHANIYLGEYETKPEAIAARYAAEKALFTHAKVPPAAS